MDVDGEAFTVISVIKEIDIIEQFESFIPKAPGFQGLLTSNISYAICFL